MQQQERSETQRRTNKQIAPPVVAQCAETQRLGRLTARYTFSDTTLRGCFLSLFLAVLSVMFLSTGFLLVWYAIKAGVVLMILPGMLIPLATASLIGKAALKAGDGDSAEVYVHQHGLVYLHEEECLALRWEQVERVEKTDGPVRHCRVTLADGGSITLINGGRHGLSEEIRRRVMRFRKKQQHHPDAALSSELLRRD